MLIDVRDLAKGYRLDGTEIPALRGVTFAVRAGEFVAVRGTSGCGKSTLLHVLGLLAEPDGGVYLLGGRDLRRATDEERAALRNRCIGFVFQQFNLLPRVSVLDNVALPAVYRTGRPDRRRALECLDRVGIADLAGRHPNQLSGGQQQRVAIARALLHDPPLLLADEPTGNLDSASAESVLEAIESLHRQGATVLLVTHEAGVAARAGRQIVLRDGRIVGDSGLPPAGPAADAAPAPFAVEPPRRPAAHRLLATHLRQALAALRAHLARAALSALGVLTGTFALMVTVLLLAGARESVRLQMEALGTNLLIVMPQADESRNRPPPRLTREDARLAAATPGVRAAAGVVLGSAELAVEGRPPRTTPVAGAEASMADLSNGMPAAGRFFTADEVERGARVIVLGATPARLLFGAASPVGRTVSVNGLPFRVIGRLPERGANPWRDTDDLLVLPVTTALKPVLGKTDLDQIQVEVADAGRMAEVERRLRAALARRRGDAADTSAFRVRDMSRIRRTFEELTAILSRLLLSVSAVSLLVGGIGIMNIMLVAVTERTREIGIRKALGARARDVRAQFLAEAALLSGAGGAAGAGLGFAVLRLAGGLGVPAGWAGFAAAAALAAAAATGIGFGFWPASRAARREPVVALRYE